MSLKETARFAKIKGLRVIGTGDFTHPKWFREIKEKLVDRSELGLYEVARAPELSVNYMITTEVCTTFTFNGRVKKIHHVILAPSAETAAQVNDRLATHGDLTADGRPTLDMSAPQLVEEVMETSSRNMVIPAHIWTPWFSLFGAFSGFNSVAECYQDMTKHIYSLETGLSSDPPMNWRLSALDRYTLISNSDCHSFWPWRIGREANVFEINTLGYDEIIETIKLKDRSRFSFTIETDPAYGKYHWTGHRGCRVALSAEESIGFGNVCPVCRKELTKGVEQRAEELADRPAGFEPSDAIGFIRLLPLSDIIATVLNVDSPSSGRVWNIYNKLMERFGNEYSVLLDATKERLGEVADDEIAEAVLSVREGRVRVIPGYDGVYGKPVLSAGNSNETPIPERVQQLNITDFGGT